MSEFLAQGGYGFYIWSSFGISFIALAAAAYYTLSAYRKAKRGLARLQDSETNI